jgi:tetratricopeptide (TPR) repeat protein
MMSLFPSPDQFVTGMPAGRATRKRIAVPLVAAGLLACFLCAATAVRNAAWKDEAVFLENMIRNSPAKPRAYYNLACVYSDRHRYDDAIAMFTRSIELYPAYNSADNARSRGFHSNAYLNRGMAYKEKGQFDRALADLTSAIASDPGLASAYAGRGELYGMTGKTALALKDYRKACDLGDAAGCAAAALLVTNKK